MRTSAAQKRRVPLHRTRCRPCACRGRRRGTGACTPPRARVPVERPELLRLGETARDRGGLPPAIPLAAQLVVPVVFERRRHGVHCRGRAGQIPPHGGLQLFLVLLRCSAICALCAAIRCSKSFGQGAHRAAPAGRNSRSYWRRSDARVKQGELPRCDAAGGANLLHGPLEPTGADAGPSRCGASTAAPVRAPRPRTAFHKPPARYCARPRHPPAAVRRVRPRARRRPSRAIWRARWTAGSGPSARAVGARTPTSAAGC